MLTYDFVDLHCTLCCLQSNGLIRRLATKPRQTIQNVNSQDQEGPKKLEHEKAQNFPRKGDPSSEMIHGITGQGARRPNTTIILIEESPGD